MRDDTIAKKENVWLYIVVPVLLFNTLPLFVFGAFYAMAYARSDDVTKIDIAQPLFWLYLAIAAINWGLALFAILRLQHERKSLKALIAPNGKLFQFRWMPALSMFIAFNAIWVAYVMLYTFLTGQWPSYRGMSDWQRVLYVLLFPVSAGFTEELYWRGFVITRLQSHGRTAQRAILFSAIGFSLIHGIFLPDKLLVTFLIGLLNGWYYVRERTLTPLMFTHTFVDVWSYGLSLFVV